MDDETYTLADLAKITGAKRRTAQLWAEAGAIRAEAGTERQGAGTHRRFTRKEVFVACILRAFALRKMSIGELIDIGEAVRKFLERRDDRAEFEAAMMYSEEVRPYLVMTTSKPGAWKATLARVYSQKEKAALFDEAVSHLDAPESMTHIIKISTYLRPP